MPASRSSIGRSPMSAVAGGLNGARRPPRRAGRTATRPTIGASPGAQPARADDGQGGPPRGVDGHANIRSIGTAGSQYGEFQTALRTGSFDLAFRVARDLPQLTLADALRLTLLAAKKAPDRYDEMA